jgi:hypothetical protein
MSRICTLLRAQPHRAAALPQVSYVFLVDQEGRIRWKGVGYAQHHEMKSLLECASQLTRLR